MSICSLIYSASVTGDCSNTGVGSFLIDIIGSAPDYTITWVNPAYGTGPLSPGQTTYGLTGLYADTYVFYINDSCLPSSTSVLVSIPISSGTCCSIEHQNTLCGLDNGSITATTSNFYGNASFYLYETTDGYITSGNSLTQNYTFTNLSAGTYYVVANDGGGCTGSSQSCIVKSSTTVSFGLYVVNDSGCSPGLGKIYITGLTGNPPFSYLWSNGETENFISGLTAGSYSVTVTDGTGCSQGLGTLVNFVPPLGLASFMSVSPTCFNSDGELTVTVTGGTSPYYFSGSNGDTSITFSDSYTFTNLSSGYFGVYVVDAGLCTLNTGTSILTPGGFSLVSLTTSDSICGNNVGSINITLLGGSPPYVYSITGTSGNITTISSSSPNYSFIGLSADTYSLQISDNGPCVYNDTITINTVNNIDLYYNVTGTTCELNNGSIELYLSGGTGPYTYGINGSSVITAQSAVTFTNLYSGNYLGTVTDSLGCTVNQWVIVNNVSNIDFILSGIDPTTGNNGEISVFITDGTPLFNITWSDNVNGQTGLNVNSLTAGTYSVTITDSYGCTLSRTIDLIGYNNLVSYEVFNICDSTFNNNGINTKKGPKQMLNEGFYDLTTGDTICILNNAIFIAQVTISGVTTEQSFYTGYTLNDYPADNEFYDVVTTLINTFPGIDSVIVDPINNSITINAGCTDQTVSFSDVSVVITLKINYDISCVECEL